jgi:hypothetical protein
MKTTFSRRRLAVAASLALSCSLVGGVAMAQAKYGPGASAKEIKLGQTMPYSVRPRPTAPSARCRPPTSRRSMTKAASMAA